MDKKGQESNLKIIVIIILLLIFLVLALILFGKANFLKDLFLGTSP